MSLNQVQIIGNLGRDPDIRTFDSGDRVANFSVACSEKWKDRNTGEQKERTEWVNVSAFGGVVGVIEKYVHKGTKIFVQGKLQTRKWQDKDGNDRWTTEVIVRGFGSKIELLGGRQESSGGSGYSSPPPAGDIDDEIPF